MPSNRIVIDRASQRFGVIYLTNAAFEKSLSGPDRPVFVLVSASMESAGLDELRENHFGDPAYLVRSIYMAMEYARLASLGKLGAVTDESIQVLKRECGDLENGAAF